MEPLPDQSRARCLAYSGKMHLCLVGFVSLLLFLKNAPLFLAGQFVSEDSFYFYETAYNADWWTAISTPYAGYLHVLPMLLAELLWQVPFAILPWVNHVVALVLCVLLLSSFYTPYCRKLVPSDGARAACVLLMALTPHQPNLGMLLGLHWYLSFAAGLVLLSDIPRKPAAVAALAVFMVLTAWSAPAAVVLIPVALVRWRLWRKDLRRYVPLAFAVASIAYAMAIQFVFKPGSSQPGFAEVSVAIEAIYIMATQGLLLDSIWGAGVGRHLPALPALLLQVAVVGAIITFTWKGRRSGRTWIGILLIGIGGLVLGLAMLRGFQSALIVKTGEPVAGRYLATPGFYLWAGIFVIMAAWMSVLNRRGQLLALGALTGVASLLSLGAPALSGDTPLTEAFPHAAKAERLAAYEARIAAGAQPETLALPGWTPIECMRLDIGGGRACPGGGSLECIFGKDLERLGAGYYRVEWLGELRHIEGDWYRHEKLGAIAALSYQKGFYWLQDATGQRYLTGPAIYPKLFEYPLRNKVWVRAKRRD